MANDSDSYLIWSNEHRAYWKPRSSGYTTSIDGAGIYSRDEALCICGDANMLRCRTYMPNELPVRLEDALIACSTMSKAAGKRERGSG